MIGWFRVPPWCYAVHDEEAAPRARAWVYLLGAWDSGDDPPTREVRRVTGFGQGRADTLVRDVAAWAIENGARLPARVAEQHRSGVGAGAEQRGKGTTPKVKQCRSGVGAASEQERSASRARILFQGEETVDVDADLEFSAPVPGAAPSPEHSTASDDTPPPPSDEDYYASETSEGAALSPDAPTVDRSGGHNPRSGVGGERSQGQPSVVGSTTPEAGKAPSPAVGRVAAVDAGGEVEGAAGELLRTGSDSGQVAQPDRHGAVGHPHGRAGVAGSAGVGVDLGGPRQRTGSDDVRALGADAGRAASVGLFPVLNPPAVASESAAQATPLPDGVAGKGTEVAAPAPPSPYHRAIEVFNEEHLSIIGTAYPWQFKGRDADGARVKSWLGTARVTVEDPDAGLMRLRGAARAYLLAVEARTAWPIGEPAQTRHFTRDLPKWLQVDPSVAPQRPGAESKQSAALRALGKIDLSRFKKPPMEAP